MQTSHLSIVQPDDAPPPVLRRHIRRRAAPLSDPRDIICPIDQACTIIFRRYGRRNGPNVLVLGGKTSTRFIAGEHGWWAHLIKSGGVLDITRFAVLGVDAALDPRNAHARHTPDASADLIARALQRSNLWPLYAVIACADGAQTALQLASRTKSAVERLCVIAPPEHWSQHSSNTLAAIEAETTIVSCGEGPSALERLSTLRRLRAYHALNTPSGAQAYLHETARLAPILKALLNERAQ